MKRIVQFIADDGTVFDDEGKCMLYERESEFKSMQEQYGFRLWDINKNPTNSISDAYYIEVFNEESIDYLIEIADAEYTITPWTQFDSCNLPTIPGIYGYDTEADVWFVITDRIREYQEILDILGYSI